MATRMDPNIIMSSVGQSVPLNDLSQVYMNAATYRQHQNAAAAEEETLRQKQVMNQAYAKAVRPDGSIDNGILQSELAQNNVGTAIPAVQKANSDLAKTNAETTNTRATTDKTVQEVLYNGLKLVDNTIASLAARPDVNEQMVYGEMGRLVNAGAFNAQAQHAGTDPDTYARQLLSTMPVGNPPALHAWLVQSGARVADATKRMEMSVPQYSAQDQGGQINQGTVDQFTGQRTPGQNIQKTATPGEIMNDATTRRGQNMTDQRVRDTAALDIGVKGLTEEQNTALSTAINEGRLDPNRINSRTASVFADLALKNPHTDFNKLGADSALMKNAAYQQKTMVASTLPEIMNNMVESGKKLGFSDLKPVGDLQAWYKKQTNDPQFVEYMNQRNDALMSIAGVMRGVGMTDMAHKAETEVASPTMSPAALDAWLSGQMKSLQPRLQNNARIMHTPPPGGTAPATGGTAPTLGAMPGTSGRPSLDSFYKGH